jgi:predicted DsbA family dithiol-disulfide isomerase
MKIEIYSDVACPWCYIGKARFERALADFPGADGVEVVYRPYQLDPQAPREAVPMFDYLERRFGPGGRRMAERVIQEARGEGLEMDYERGLAANTLDAHRLLSLAEREAGAEVQRAVAEALFRAHFSEGRDIADAEVLTEIAGRAGMDAKRVRAYLGGGEGRAEVEAEIEQARLLGITAVPTFVLDGTYAVQGAQSTATFRSVLGQVSREAAEAGSPPE